MARKLALALILASCGGPGLAPGAFIDPALEDAAWGDAGAYDAAVALPALDGGTADAGTPQDDAGALGPTDGGAAEEDAGEAVAGDAGAIADAGYGSSTSDDDAGAPDSGWGDWCDRGRGLYWLASGQTCSLQAPVACVWLAGDCGFSRQRPCNADGHPAGSLDSRYCIEGLQPYGAGGTCTSCR